jgi:hypothetical protein
MEAVKLIKPNKIQIHIVLQKIVAENVLNVHIVLCLKTINVSQLATNVKLGIKRQDYVLNAIQGGH